MNIFLKYFVIFSLVSAILVLFFYQSATPLTSPSVIPTQAEIHPSGTPITLTPQTKTPELTLLFGGDVMLGRSVNTQMLKRSNYGWPTDKISVITKNSDLFLVNLEGPFKLGCNPTDKGMVFCEAPQNSISINLQSHRF